MDKMQFQRALKLRGNYHGIIDGSLGAMSKTAFLQAVTEGSDRKLTKDVINLLAKGNNLLPSRVYAVIKVESSGNGFDQNIGRGIVLHEGHYFSRLTGGKFDKTNSDISYPSWDRTKYPGSQSARWDQIARSVLLDVDAGLSSASHGLFQIMGANYAACGFASPFDFVMAMSLSEDAQIEAFVSFINNKVHRGERLIHWLRIGRFDYFAEGYNGSAYKANAYDVKLGAADKANAGMNV